MATRPASASQSKEHKQGIGGLTSLTISVVVYSYQRPTLLRNCLRHLAAQGRAPDEIIVVAKEWDSPTIATAGSFPAVRVVTTSELDIGSAVNSGLLSARSEVVAFVDDDAEAPRDWLERVAQIFTDPAVGAAGGRDELYLDGLLIQARPGVRVGRITWYGRVTGNHHVGTGDRRDVDVLKGCNMAVRRNLVVGVSRELKGPYTYRWEDDLCAQVRSRRARVVYDPHVVVLHRSSRPVVGRVDHAAAGRYVSAHNLAYVQYRYLSGWRRVVWLAFSLLVGQPDEPGLLRAAGSSPGWQSAFRGKLAGMRSAIQARRAAPR